MKPYYDSGGITIFHGDCHEVMPSLSGMQASVISDPPYGVKLAEWDRYPTQEELDMCRNFKGPCLWFGAAPAHCIQALLSLKPLCDRIFIWHNPFTLTNSQGAFWQYQPIYVWGKTRGLKRDILTFVSMDDIRRIHPAQKPELLIRTLIESVDEQVIIDPFMGSGTTLRAAKDLSRRAVGIEINERYCEIAAQRMSQEVLEF